MKEIWINSELYIKSYEFFIFKDFFRIFMNLFSILKRFKLILKNTKMWIYFARAPRGCDVARKAYVAHYTYYIFDLIYIHKGSSAFPIWEGLLTL